MVELFDVEASVKDFSNQYRGAPLSPFSLYNFIGALIENFGLSA